LVFLKKAFLLPARAVRLINALYESGIVSGELEGNIRDIRGLLHMQVERDDKFLRGHPFPSEGYFSQSNEDSILFWIEENLLKNCPSRLFLEIGVGDGTECNSILLKARGWKGAWVDFAQNEVVESFEYRDFQFFKRFVAVGDVSNILGEFREKFGDFPNFLSVDIDGNDYHILHEFLRFYRPEVICVEYNPKFPPPIRFIMPYKEDHIWTGGDFYGASLKSLEELCADFQFKLVACSLNGNNAFFVRHEFLEDEDLQVLLQSEESIFRPAQYIFSNRNRHATSKETIRHILKDF